MKKIILGVLSMLLVFGVSGCTSEETPTNNNNGKKTEYAITETATVNKTKIKINSVKKVLKECSLEYSNKCQSYTEPENDFFLVVDVTIENTNDKELAISSILSFELKTTEGEKAKQNYFLKAVTSQLDGSIMANDLLKGQVAYDVKDSEKYYFYYQDNLLDDAIKFTINKSDIAE